jgi:hypothetical protein
MIACGFVVHFPWILPLLAADIFASARRRRCLPLKCQGHYPGRSRAQTLHCVRTQTLKPKQEYRGFSAIAGSLDCSDARPEIGGEEKYETEYTRSAVSNSNHNGSVSFDHSLGATQAHTRRTKEAGHGWHEIRDGHDDEFAASLADDGPHEEYV